MLKSNKKSVHTLLRSMEMLLCKEQATFERLKSFRCWIRIIKCWREHGSILDSERMDTFLWYVLSDGSA